MSGREWLPAAWLDETVPRAAAHPNQFLANVGGVWHLRVLDESDGTTWEPISLGVGEAVAFSFRDRFGRITVEVDADGGFDVSGGTYPVHANCFADDDGEEVYFSIEDYVETGDLGDRLSSGSYDVDVYFWSEEIAFRLDVNDGWGQLVPVDGLPLDAEERR